MSQPKIISIAITNGQTLGLSDDGKLYWNVLDEILEQLFTSGVQWSQTGGTAVWKQLSIAESKAKIEELYVSKSLAEEAIGEDEQTSLKLYKNTDREYWKRVDAGVRNNLRDEIRAKLNLNKES